MFHLTGSLSGSASFGQGTVASPLPGGGVLIAGGKQAQGGPCACPALDGAAIFSPATGTFSSAGVGSMGIRRLEAVAAPLPGGRVLVAGGYTSDAVGNNFTKVSSAEVFDPATNTFSSAGVGSMGTPRAAAIAAPLPDGRVLIAGGEDQNGTALASAEVFDPATNSFSSVGIGSMGTPRVGAVAAPLPGGRVLVVGGLGENGVRVTSAEVFDPAANSFAGAGPAPDVAFGAASPLADGRVLIVSAVSAVVFDAATNSFGSQGIGPVQIRRSSPSAAAIPGGRVLVAAGETLMGDPGIPGAVIGPAEVFVPCCSNDFAFRVRGRTLYVDVESAGRVDVVPAATTQRTTTTAAKKRKKRGGVPLRQASKEGGPGTIAVQLSLERWAKRKLKRKGKVRASATITFSPHGGIPKSESASLRLTGKKKKKKKKR